MVTNSVGQSDGCEWSDQLETKYKFSYQFKIKKKFIDQHEIFLKVLPLNLTNQENYTKRNLLDLEMFQELDSCGYESVLQAIFRCL